MSLPTKSISELKKKYECVSVYMHMVCVRACTTQPTVQRSEDDSVACSLFPPFIWALEMELRRPNLHSRRLYLLNHF